MSGNPVNSRSGDQMSPDGAVVDWDRIIHKNVRTADNQGFGKVIAVPDNEDTIVISSQSGKDQYKIPKSNVSGFNGAEVSRNNYSTDGLLRNEGRRTSIRSPAKYSYYRA